MHFFFLFHSSGKCLYASMGKGGEVAIMSISLRETACVKGFVGQRERTQGWAGQERNTDKYLESELFVHPGRVEGESERG